MSDRGTASARLRDTPIRHVNIRPGVNMLTVLPHLNYKPWFAIAEFVDNAVQSYLANRTRIRSIEGRRFCLQVDIVFDANENRISIRDNAAGISARDYQRAFRPAEVPPDASGLSEFGMGMKSAACWFTPTWSVRSSALGEGVERTVSFDIRKIVKNSAETLHVETRRAVPNAHFTEVTLSDVPRFPKTKTVAKIKEHLTDIYRCFLRDGQMQLHLNGEMLAYEDPEILKAPYYLNENGPSRLWRLDVDVSLEGGRRVQGFVAIRSKGATARAGFALFRRGRLIQGSGDEGYRPDQIFGRSNSFTYQRVFGELHLTGFSVSHTKDGIQWGDTEDEFLTKLHDALAKKAFPLLQQAEGFRAKAHAAKLVKDGEVALKNTANAIETNVPPVLEELQALDDEAVPTKLPAAKERTFREVNVALEGEPWTIEIELSADPSIADWLTISDHLSQKSSSAARVLAIRVSTAHPFMLRFAANGAEEIEALLRIAAALALAEVRARDGGLKKAGTIRRNVNQLLREALSKP